MSLAKITIRRFLTFYFGNTFLLSNFKTSTNFSNIKCIATTFVHYALTIEIDKKTIINILIL